MRFVIYGAGAVGGVTGALLARAGREVVLIARGEHHAAIARDGLIVETPDETFTVRVPVVDHPAQIAWREGDVALLAVKTQDVDECVRELAAVAPSVTTVCLTNGVEAERIAARHLSDVHGGCVFMPVTHLVPGVVQAFSWPHVGSIDVGRYPHGAGVVSVAVDGLASRSTDDIMRLKRGKLLGNLGNAVEALSGPLPRPTAILDRVRAEGIACFEAAGLSRTSQAEDDAQWASIDIRSIAGAPRPGGSTWQSLARGHTLEVDYLNGEIALLGRLHGVPTPVNAALQRLANAAARAGARPGALPLAELEAQILGG